MNFKATRAIPWDSVDARSMRQAERARISFLLRNNCERSVVVTAARHATSTLTLSKFQLSLASLIRSSLLLLYSRPFPVLSCFPLRLSQYILASAPTSEKRSLRRSTGWRSRVKRKTVGKEETLCIIRQEIPRDWGNRSSGTRFSYRARSSVRSLGCSRLN